MISIRFLDDLYPFSAVPGAVTNVRVFVYHPLTGEDVFSALVLWDAPAAVSSVDTYSVIVRRDGVTVSDVSEFV